VGEDAGSSVTDSIETSQPNDSTVSAANSGLPFQPQFPNVLSSSHAETYPQGAPVYPPGTAPTSYTQGSAPMHPQMMAGRDFSQTRAGGFQSEEHGMVFHPSQGAWQSGLGNESAAIPPPSSGMAPQGDSRAEFHPNLESVAPQDPHEGNLPT